MSAIGHRIERTSPKGLGQKFIGTCAQCGKAGLTFADIDEDCPNPDGLTQDEALIAAIDAEDTSHG